MPPADADSDEEAETGSDNDSPEILDADDLVYSDEEREAAVARVSFDWCRTVREAGDQYREGVPIAVLARELEVPEEKARRAVETYYLVFSETPALTVNRRVFRRGRRFFKNGVVVDELYAETQTAAEESVRAFVGQTLLDNDLDTVDIAEPLPEMDVPSVTTGLSTVDAAEVTGIASIAESLQAAAGPSSPVLSDVQKASQTIQDAAEALNEPLMRDVQRVVDGFSRQGVSRVQELAQSASLPRSVTRPAVVSTAAVSSVTAASMAGVDPAVFEPVASGALQISGVAPVIDVVGQSAVQEMAASVNMLPSISVMELGEMVDQRMQELSRAVAQLGKIQQGMAGLGAMSAAAMRPDLGQAFELSGPGQVFDQSEMVRQPQESESVEMSTASVADQEVKQTRWIIHLMREHSSEVAGAASSGATGLMFHHLTQMYPSQQPAFGYIEPVAGTAVAVIVIIAMNNK